MATMPRHNEIYEIVAKIPVGRVVSYGDLARIVRVPPRAVGGAMKQCLELSETPLPWWRVVGHDGRFPLAKYRPDLALEQARLLAAEEVGFKASDQVAIEAFRWEIEF